MHNDYKVHSLSASALADFLNDTQDPAGSDERVRAMPVTDQSCYSYPSLPIPVSQRLEKVYISRMARST